MIRKWKKDPVAFVRDVFGAEPDVWQGKALEAIVVEPRVAMSACKGPGKSCLLAWMIWWFLTVNENAQVIAVSITADNLKDNIWKELALWRARSDILKESFTINSERIISNEQDKDKTWWASARSFPRSSDASQQANTLAGFHGENLLVVLDEVGDYPDGVLSAAEAIFANDVNAKLVVAGNPTRTDGPLYRIVTKEADKWHIIKITGDPDDPNRSPRISMEWARDGIQRWGRDNPWVMVNILGEFPAASANQLIASDVVARAMVRDLPARTRLSDARIWGLDPSRFGDDEACLARRQGVLARRFITWRNKDGTQLGDAVASLMFQAREEGEFPDALFVDVGGIGSSVYDRLRVLGWDDVVVAVDFGSKASDKRFLNKRAEIWWDMAEWLKKMPACLPNCNVLSNELPGPRFEFKETNKRTSFKLESKDSMKKRGIQSPNRADALALTFAGVVMPKAHEVRTLDMAYGSAQAETEYDTLGLKRY